MLHVLERWREYSENRSSLLHMRDDCTFSSSLPHRRLKQLHLDGLGGH
jgi:hypothetical protein